MQSIVKISENVECLLQLLEKILFILSFQAWKYGTSFQKVWQLSTVPSLRFSGIGL
jgi:hypothetical protein